jgi:hypothetical protein
MHVKMIARFLRARKVRRGWHWGMALQHVPSGKGPFSHLPPPDFGRVQAQWPLVSPGLVTSRGEHS